MIKPDNSAMNPSHLKKSLTLALRACDMLFLFVFTYAVSLSAATAPVVVLDTAGQQIRSAKITSGKDRIDLVLTNRRFVLDLRNWKSQERLIVSINEAICFEGEIPKTGLLYFPSKASSVPVTESFFRAQKNPAKPVSGEKQTDIIAPVQPAQVLEPVIRSPDNIASPAAPSVPVPALSAPAAETQKSYIPIQENTPASEATPQNREKSIEIIKTRQADRIRIPNILFNKDRYDLTSQSRKAFLSTAPLFARNFVKIIIKGHTDTSGTAEYNNTLSEKRAETIRDLIRKEFKVSPDRIETRGMGPSEPEADNATESGRQMNRRVTIEIIREQ